MYNFFQEVSQCFLFSKSCYRQWEHWKISAAAAAKSLQSCLTLWDPRDGSPPGSPIPGIFQARTLEWVAISFSNVWKWKVKVKSFSRVQKYTFSGTLLLITFYQYIQNYSLVWQISFHHSALRILLNNLRNMWKKKP